MTDGRRLVYILPCFSKVSNDEYNFFAARVPQRSSTYDKVHVSEESSAACICVVSPGGVVGKTATLRRVVPLKFGLSRISTSQIRWAQTELELNFVNIG